MEDRALAAREDGNWERSMDQKDNRFYRERDERIDAVESARAMRRIGHLIEAAICRANSPMICSGSSTWR